MSRKSAYGIPAYAGMTHRGGDNAAISYSLDARGVFWGVLTAFVIGIPLFIYGNIIDRPVWIVGASLFIIAVSTGFCLAMPKRATNAVVV